ncbi:elongin-A isoform X2 [Tachysurus fulvidraco]|uniref:elongin-A isoform X2 n=1 Tax=Tachysurus fulvidraco TaxID=1234273 RepID=UPI000F4DE55A|nr:elongin-A isoform X2 [Tachysurus fulvidraco]
MAEDLLEAVEKLQSRLSENQEPRKLLKTLKRLGELPITVDILVETGVGKAVNSLRKHNIVGETAKDLVAKWKKLVPQSADRPSNAKVQTHSRPDKARGYKRIREPSPEQPPPVEDEEDEEVYHQDYSPPSQQNYSQQYSHRSLGGYQSEEYESPVDEPVPSPPQKQIEHSKSHREQEHGSHSSREQQRQNRSAQVQSEAQIRYNREQKEITTHPSSKRSHQSSIQESRKEKKRVSDGREKRDKPEPEQDDDEENSFETPTMSFESFLTYDEPTHSKKKKKLSRPSQPITPVASVSSKSNKANGTSFKRPEPSVSTPTVSTKEKRRKVLPQIIDVVPALPDIPLPAIQPNYRPLPSIDVTPLSPQRRKVPVAHEEEDTGFTGRRFNSKMVVYSGSKTAYLPKMMTLYEQCIRVLQNHIDSIDEVGGVPYEILVPVLERCTPEQLYRIEQCNQSFIEESDELWLKHCKRDFKRESPQEYETWRELYLRLHDEREERLRKLTQNISSAHANKPKGRQVKMAYVNSVAKPPRDVQRRQKLFGTKNGSTSTSVSASAPIQVKIRAPMPHSSYSQSSDGGQSSHSSPPEPSHSPAPSSSAGHSFRDKPQVKKIAPMMAKTIKAFKNRFSRR